MKGAVLTAAMLAVAWFAWTYAAVLASWAGFDELDILVQLAGLLAALALAEALLSRVLRQG